MKKILILIIVCFTLVKGRTQITINLIVNPNPPAKLAEWNSRAGTINLLVTNIGTSRTVKVRTTLTDPSGQVIGFTDPSRTRNISIPLGTTLLNTIDVFPLELMQFSTGASASILKTGKLPQGSYQLCVRLDSALTLTPITTTQCRNMNLVGLQLPFLLVPYDGQKLPTTAAKTAITFRWTNVLKAGTDQPNYQLEVYEILPTQQPVQALRSNQPLLVTTIKGTTQYIWRAQLLFNDSLTHQFIWTIKTTDAQGNVLSATDGNEEGRSEPKVFSIGSITPSKRKNK